jgi:hypothetical protein
MTTERDSNGPLSSPPALEDVLRALGEESPGVERLAEVAHKLGPVLEAELPAAAATASGLYGRPWRAMSGAAALGLVVVTLGAVVGRQGPDKLPHAEAPARASTAAVSDAPTVLQSPTASQGTLDAARNGPRETVTSPRPKSLLTPSVEARGSSARERSLPASTTTDEPRAPRTRRSGAARPRLHAKIAPPVGDMAQTLADDASPRGVSASGVPESLNERSLRSAERIPSEASAPRSAPSGRSEPDLIRAARAAALRDPRAAQRLLDEHAARFPDGLLALEREVLAIEVLRTLGQQDAATKRLAAFRKRYPDFVPLRRLESPSR